MLASAWDPIIRGMGGGIAARASGWLGGPAPGLGGGIWACSERVTTLCEEIISEKITRLIDNHLND